MPRRLDCYAACLPGLEALVADELAGLGVRPGRTGRGGVPFPATTRQLYLANVALRTATRVVVRLGSFRARTFDELVAGAEALDWAPVLPHGARPVFRVTSHRSRLYHTDAVAERLTRAVEAAVGLPADRGAPEQAFVVRLDRDRVEVSADSSGEPLHRRGWRQATAKAPLRETVAAALLLAAGWTPDQALADPFCGAGTIPVEAARTAAGIAPGSDRTFAFADWPDFEPGTWASVAGEAAGWRQAAGDGAPILGRDRDAGAIEAAADNADRAGVADRVSLAVAALSDLDLPPGPGWIVTNPPWGHRTATGGRHGDLRDLHARLGQIVAASPGWGLAVLVADPALAHHSGLPLTEVLTVDAGGRRLHVLVSPPG